MKKAYSILETKGVIVTISTKGTYIAYDTGKIVEEKINSKINELKIIIEELKKLGITEEKIIQRIK